MKVSIIAIGDELLIGQVVDTNSGMIASMINPDGWEVESVRVVADDAEAIRRAISQAFEETDVVLTTGGLGPTKDDITKQVLCDYFGGEMIYDTEVEKNVLEVVTKRGFKINPLTAAQAWVPSSCTVIQNRVGTAPLMWFEKEGKVLVSMPGVPFETKEMFATEVFPRLKQKYDTTTELTHATYIVINNTESAVAGKLDDYEKQLPPFLHLAYLPKPGVIRLRLTGRHSDRNVLAAAMSEQGATLKSILGSDIIADSDLTPAAILGNLLREQSLTIATAESCTGGNISHEITLVAGSSDYYAGSVVSYANDVKTKVLGVNIDDISNEGAVSETVVRQMAEGVAKVLGVDCAIATSGVAGPAGGTLDKPVGTVWMAVTLRGVTESRLCRFAGNRERVINHATTIAILEMIKMLIKQKKQ